jgi:hypothetical protein
LPFSLLFLLLFHNFRALNALFAILLFFKNSSFLLNEGWRISLIFNSPPQKAAQKAAAVLFLENLRNN